MSQPSNRTQSSPCIIIQCVYWSWVPSAYRNVLRLHDDGRYVSRRQVQSDARPNLLHEFLRQRRLGRHLEEENDALFGPVFTPLRDAQTVHNLLDRLHCQNQQSTVSHRQEPYLRYETRHLYTTVYWRLVNGLGVRIDVQ